MKFNAALLFGALTLCLLSGSAFAQDGKFHAGVQYDQIDQIPGTQPADHVQVTEVFSYLCSHCNAFDPYMQNWMKKLPADVELNRIPVGFGRATWELYAQAYEAASIMGIADKSHVAMMDAIWKEHKQMRTMDELADFYAQFGVSKSDFLATAKSFAVDAQMRHNQQMARSWGVNGTPTMIVDGKYRVTVGGQVHGFDEMLDVVDYLVDKELSALHMQQADAASAANKTSP